MMISPQLDKQAQAGLANSVVDGELKSESPQDCMDKVKNASCRDDDDCNGGISDIVDEKSDDYNVKDVYYSGNDLYGVHGFSWRSTIEHFICEICMLLLFPVGLFAAVPILGYKGCVFTGFLPGRLNCGSTNTILFLFCTLQGMSWTTVLGHAIFAPEYVRVNFDVLIPLIFAIGRCSIIAMKYGYLSREKLLEYRENGRTSQQNSEMMIAFSNDSCDDMIFDQLFVSLLKSLESRPITVNRFVLIKPLPQELRQEMDEGFVNGAKAHACRTSSTGCNMVSSEGFLLKKMLCESCGNDEVPLEVLLFHTLKRNAGKISAKHDGTVLDLMTVLFCIAEVVVMIRVRSTPQEYLVGTLSALNRLFIMFNLVRFLTASKIHFQRIRYILLDHLEMLRGNVHSPFKLDARYVPNIWLWTYAYVVLRSFGKVFENRYSYAVSTNSLGLVLIAVVMVFRLFIGASIDVRLEEWILFVYGNIYVLVALFRSLDMGAKLNEMSLETHISVLNKLKTANQYVMHQTALLHCKGREHLHLQRRLDFKEAWDPKKYCHHVNMALDIAKEEIISAPRAKLFGANITEKNLKSAFAGMVSFCIILFNWYRNLK